MMDSTSNVSFPQLKLENSISNNLHHVLPVPLIISIFVSIQLVGFFGNIFVLFILIKKMRVQTNSNWLILNLALSDLIVLAFCMPLDIPLMIYKKWIYGEAFCSLFYPIGTAAVLSSAFTLLILTCQRYWAAVHPYKKQPTTCMTKIFITLSWLLSFSFAIPLMDVLKHNKGWEVCYEDWDSSSRRFYTVCIFVVGFVLPLLIMMTLHGCIILKTVIKSSESEPSWKSKSRRLEDKRLCKVAFIITLAFAVCILPNHVVWFLYEFGNLADFKYQADVSLTAHIMLFISSALNPIIYASFSSRFRASLPNYSKESGLDLHESPCQSMKLKGYEIIPSFSSLFREQFRKKLSNSTPNVFTSLIPS